MNNRTVWKFPVSMFDPTDVRLANPTIVHVAHDRPSGHPAAWIEHDEAATADTLIRFVIVGTGQPVPHSAHHAGTAITPDGFVWHLYETRSTL